MKKVLLLLMFLCATPAVANFQGLNKGTRALGMGNAFSAMGEIGESIFFNAAGPADIENYSLSTSYQNHYGISDLVNLELNAFAPYREFTAGIAIQQANLLDVYSESIYYLNVSWKKKLLRSNFKAGINFKYFNITSETDKVSLSKPVDADLGFIYQFKDVNLAYSGKNLLLIAGESDNLFCSHTLGLAVKWQDLLRYSADFEMRSNENLFRTGIELWFFDTFAPRVGFDDKYLTMGFGLQSNWWKFDFGIKTHQKLGSTYRFGLSLEY